MSTLNSHDDLVRSIVLNGGQPSAEAVTAAGLDVELLAGALTRLKPHLDYLRGYQPIDEFFHRYSGERSGVPMESWWTESGLAGQYPYCLKLLDSKMRVGFDTGWGPLIPSERNRYPGEHNPRYHDYHQRLAVLRVFMTRKVEWIVWASYPTSVFRTVGSLPELVAAIKELTPPEAKLYTSCPLLEMCRSLMRQFERSLTQKKAVLLIEEEALKEVRQPFSRFAW